MNSLGALAESLVQNQRPLEEMEKEMFTYAFDLLDRNNELKFTKYEECRGYIDAVQKGTEFFVTMHNEENIDYKSLLIRCLSTKSADDHESVFFATFTPDASHTTKKGN